MTKYLEKIIRVIILVLGISTEVLILYGTFHFFTSYFAWIEAILRLASVVVVVNIVNSSRTLSTDMIWVLLIMLLPVPGTIIYLLLGADLFASKTVKSLNESDIASRKYLVQDENVLKEMESKMPYLKGDFYYISKSSAYPFYRNSDFTYYELGDTGYPEMLKAMDSAEKFIFLEYFIIEEGIMWDGMHEILKKKAAQGLDVRVMYDDAGSLLTLSNSYSRKLEEEGIKCVCFNQISPIAGAVMNHRDHRKIMVIDGKIAFSGGINLADEYINKKERFGHWKDNCIKIEGEAVWSYTVLFLTNWNALRKTDEDYTVFKLKQNSTKEDGYIAAYGDTPFDNEKTGQCIYTNIINSANKYLYICTPYLLIDTDLENALILAARKGVDVRIITPGIPDKKMVWLISRSYYTNLIEGGVKVYEYTPGFIHAKNFVCDDLVATVGTVNLDYRSLYLHFENGTYLCASKEVLKVRDDLINTMKQCHEVKVEDVKTNALVKIVVAFAKLFVSQM